MARARYMTTRTTGGTENLFLPNPLQGERTMFKLKIEGVIEDTLVFDEDESEKASQIIDEIIERATNEHIRTQIECYGKQNVYECGWTVLEDGTVII